MTRVASFATLLTFVTACLAATPVKRTVAQVEADLNSIASQVTVLNNDLKAFPTSGGSLASAFAIHAQATELASSLAAAAVDVTDTPASTVTEADASNVLALVQGFEPTIIEALNELVAKKPGFDSIPIVGPVTSGVVAADLAALGTSAKNFENAVIVDTPPDFLSDAESITSAIDAALATASAAYA